MPATATAKADIRADAVDPPLVRAAWMTFLEGYTVTNLIRDGFPASQFLICQIFV